MMDNDKLYPAGRVLWLVPGKGEDKGAPFDVFPVAPDMFERLVLCRSMVSEHIIGNYERALASLLPPGMRKELSEAVESIASLEQGPRGDEGAVGDLPSSDSPW